MDATILHVRTSKWGLALYILPLIGAMNRLLEKNGIEKDYITQLISGLPTNKTLDASLELRKLAGLIRKDSDTVDIFKMDFKDYNEYKCELEKFSKGEYIIGYFESILAKFGHRRLSRDIMAPSWRDEPMIPFAVLKRLVKEDITLRDDENKSIEKRKRIERKVKGKLPHMSRWKFDLISREYQRFYLDMIISKMRELFIEIAKRMVKKSAINDIDDIFFLELPDVLGFLAGKKNGDLKSKAEFNRLSFEDYTGTPGRYLRRGVDFDSITGEKKEVRRSTGKVITGEAVSPGFFSGKVRIIDSIDKDVVIEPNDIVVTKCIDPGQTHVFLLAGALIFESGGILSHGAILAREFNLPTVAQIKNATRIFKDRQWISVNGTSGEVVVGGV
jgi:pyruvate,water dikinase